jgi:hypothetical protein
MLRVGVGIALLSLLLAGCTADLDALYADEQALIALLPARPDDPVAPGCGMCAKNNCEQQRLECEQDELCSKLLACKAPCSDPACLFECEADFEARGEHNNFHICLYDGKCPGDPDCVSECEAEHQAVEIYDAYRACVFEDECRQECATGENWQCLGDYSWTPDDAGSAAPPRLTVMVKDIDDLHGLYPGVEGADVTACSVSDLCKSNAQAFSNNFGIARFENLPLEDDNAFQGYLWFYLGPLDDEGIAYYVHHLGRPIYREVAMEEVLMPGARYLDEIANSLGVALDQTEAHIKARVYDCLNAPAPNISFSLPSPTYQQGIIEFYSITSPTIYSAEEAETNEWGMGGFGNVRVPIFVNSGLIRAVRSSDGVLVSEQEIAVAPDALTMVDLYPLEKSRDSSTR